MAGKVQEPLYHSLVSELSRGRKYFILENDTYDIEGRLDSIWLAKVSARTTTTLQETRVYALIVNPIIYEQNELSDSLMKYSSAGEVETARFYSNMNQKLSVRFAKAFADFVKYYPDSWVSLMNFKHLSEHISLEDRLNLFNSLSDRLKNHSYSKEVLFTLRDSSELMLVGNNSPNLSFVDKFGEDHKLHDQINDYLLISFWASWCKPCRAKHPDLIEFYKEYGHQVEILRVSLDVNKSSWEKAIEVDAINWLQILDLHQQEKWARLFNVLSIPTSFLVNKSGEIVGKDMSIDQIKELLDN